VVESGGPRPRAGKEVGVAEQVRAEMVANVLTVAVDEGQVVEPGQTLVLLESMKMEIPVVPETGGRVSRVAVTAGDVVQEGDLLVVLE
jgi:biotin carboxyl carrier protein